MKQDDFKIENRKARFNYLVEETYCAGIVLKGSEVKAIRNSNINIGESFCMFDDNGELYAKNCHISNKCNNTLFGHDETADRKLLLTKRELRKLRKAVSVKGYALIPLTVCVPRKGCIKLIIGLCKGKHDYDKRDSIKERDMEREMNKNMRF